MDKVFNSLLEAVNHFNNHPDYVAFNLKGDELEHPKSRERYPIDDITITKVLKFEENSDPDDTSVLILMETANDLKGFFIDATGVYGKLDMDPIS